MSFRIATIALAMIVSSVSSAAAQSAGMTLSEMAAALSDADMSTSEDGEVLRGEISGIGFTLEGYNCEVSRCSEFLFSAGFTLGAPVPLEKINQWNWERYAGRASLDAGGDPYVDHIFSVSGPGDKAVVGEAAGLWESIVLDFAEFIDLPVAGA
ncbi:MAG: YbjN domain-containing protein [Amphiplicatus sp.]